MAIKKAAAAAITRAPVKETGKVVALKKSTAMAVANDDYDDGEYGAGKENIRAKDMSIPRLVLLQDLSPQVKRNDPKYIAGSYPGQFCNTALGTVADSVKIIPCHHTVQWIEWYPRDTGKGLCTIHMSDAVYNDADVEQNEKGRWVRENGNLIQETQVYCVIDITNPDDPQKCVMGLAVTATKAAKDWNTMSMREMVNTPSGKRVAPIYHRAWDVTANEQSKNKDKWFGWSFVAAETNLEIDPSKKLRAMCRDFYDQAKAGTLKVDMDGGATSQTSDESEEV